jgi:lysophospholipase L1-like esterase
LLILVLLEFFLHFFYPFKELPKVQSEEVPFLVSEKSHSTIADKKLKENYEILMTKPLSSLPFYQQDNVVFYHPKPGANVSFTFKTPLGNIVNYKFNSSGFRSDEFEKQKPNGKIRIVCAGDSSTFGYLVNLPDTYPKQLEQMLNSNTKEKNAEVINAGVVGYSSFQGLKFFDTRIKDLKPDILSFSYGYNDSYVGGGLDSARKPEKTSTLYINKLLDNFELYKLIDKALQKIIGEKAFVPDPNSPRITQAEYRENLEYMAETCKKNGTKIIFLPISVPPSYVEIMKQVAQKYSVGFIGTEEKFKENYDILSKEKVGKYKGFSLARLSRHPFEAKFLTRFGSDEMMRIRDWNYIFMDHCHPQPIGYRIIAEELFDFLISNHFFTLCENRNDEKSESQNTKIKKIGV